MPWHAMATPRDVRVFVNNIKSRGFEAMTQQDYERLCQLALSHLPMQCSSRGKTCPHCSWKIGNAAKKCKNCGKTVGKTNIVSEPTMEDASVCKGECAEDLTDRAHHVLKCGHKFCETCIRNRVRSGFRTCCLCDHVRIDDSIRQKYLPDTV